MDDGRRRYPEVPRSADRIERDVDDELRFDLDMRIRELVAEGVPENDARERAQKEFGDIEATRVYCASVDAAVERHSRLSTWFDDLLGDLAFALRALRARPGFATVVLLTLAVGIGANAVLYSVVRRILIDPLPYRDAASLVRVRAGVPPTGGADVLTATELRDLAAVPELQSVAAFGMIGGTAYRTTSGVESVPKASITPNFFATLGTAPLIGRTFDVADASPAAVSTAIISFSLWERVFASDPQIVGRSVTFLDGAHTIIGVMPRDFVSPSFTANLWLPLEVSRFLEPSRAMYRGFRGIARLRDGAAMTVATSHAATIAAHWRADGLIRPTTPDPTMQALRDSMVGDVRPGLLSVMAAAVLLLVIACTNVAGLFLARATSRRREFAVRIALGAGRGRLIRQLLTESAVYGVLGGTLGLVVAFAVKPPLVGLANMALPNLGAIRIDVPLMATALIVAFLCSLAFGVMPAFSATRVDVKEAMGDAGRGASAGVGRLRLRQSLVSSQIALAIVLMVGAGLLLRSFSGLVGTRVGFNVDDNTLIFMLEAPSPFGDVLSRASFFSDVVTRFRAIPGVAVVGLTSIGPWNGPNGTSVRTPEMSPDADPARVDLLVATDGYFDAMGTRVLRGRGISATDRFGAPRVAVLSESAARRLFGDANAVGKRVTMNVSDGKGETLHEIVGVVEDYRPRPTADPVPAVYVSDWQTDQSARAQFVVRTTGEQAAIVAALRRLANEINPNSSLIYLRTMREVESLFLAPQRLSLEVFAVFALLALFVAALGVYAVMSYVVASRTREFGIRTALGAQRRSLVSMVLGQGLTAAAIGIAVGLALAFATTKLIAGLLVNVSMHDVQTFVLTPLALLIVVLAACALPAWRATRVDPVTALRAE